jgi:predicted enzyme related to lactoylglutathione lyase
MDVPTVGRMAGFFDPQGAFVSVMRYEPMEEGAPASDPDFVEGFATPGAFSWYHLSTPDQAAARAFYADVFGWEIRVDQMQDGPYDTIVVDGVGIGGIIPPASPGDRAHWTGFVTVADVDAALAAAVESGGTVVVPGWDIPGVGRIAEIADPTGATLWIATYASPA